MDRALKFELASIRDELKKIVRRQDEIQKSVDLIFQDREILEDIQGSIKHQQAITIANQQHQDIARDSLKADVKKVEFAVQDKVDEVKNSITEKTIIVKSTNQNIFQKIKKLISKGGDKK